MKNLDNPVKKQEYQCFPDKWQIQIYYYLYYHNPVQIMGIFGASRRKFTSDLEFIAQKAYYIEKKNIYIYAHKENFTKYFIR